MTDQGYSWRQTTVAKTEGADRPIRVNEMLGLARAFGLQIADLLTVPIDDVDVANAAALVADMAAAAAVARQRVDEYERALDKARAEEARITTELEERRAEYRRAVATAEERKAREADGE